MPFSIAPPIEAGPHFAKLRLRPMTTDDMDEWNDVRVRNSDWLKPWESQDPYHVPSLTFNQWIQLQRKQEQHGSGIVFAVEYDGRFIGQLSLGAISYGSMYTGVIGYWIDERYAGNSFTPMAVMMMADWAIFDEHGPHLHRLEIDIVPTNERSLHVAHKIGATHEGTRRKLMYINGQWTDHESFALLAEDAPHGFVARFLEANPQLTSPQAGVHVPIPSADEIIQ